MQIPLSIDYEYSNCYQDYLAAYDKSFYALEAPLLVKGIDRISCLTCFYISIQINKNRLGLIYTALEKTTMYIDLLKLVSLQTGLGFFVYYVVLFIIIIIQEYAIN